MATAIRVLAAGVVLVAGHAAARAGDAGKQTAAFCDQEWPSLPAPSAAQTRQCAELWLRRGYGSAYTDEDLTLDPNAGHASALIFTTEQLRKMEKTVLRACGKPCSLQHEPRMARAAEMLRGEADARLSLHDPIRMESIEPLLATVLHGERLQESALGLDDPTPWSAVTLWRLRNAVYARHGRSFKNPDLETFFYGRRPAAAGRTRLLPLKKLATPETALSPEDNANLSLIMRLERR